jgi:hypothetical protein
MEQAMSARDVASPASRVNAPAAPAGLLQRRVNDGRGHAEDNRRLAPGAGRPGLQRRLLLGGSEDPLEREADRVADHVLAAPALRMPSPMRQPPPPVAGGEEAPGSVADTLAGGGQPLDALLRRDMERRFSVDFSGVRVHADASAAQSTREVGALAYTVGDHIAFGAGRYAPHSARGRHTLAHELTHVVQQRSAAWGGFTGHAGWLQRAPPATPGQLSDPISGNELGHSFYPVGPDFSGMPREADIRRVLAEGGVVDPATLAASRAAPYTLSGGGMSYLAFEHPTLGIVARAGAGVFGSQAIAGGQRQTLYAVYVFATAQAALQLRPPGGTGQLRDPAPALDPMSGVAALGYADLSAKIKLIETRLAALATTYPSSDPVLGKSIAAAQVSAAALRANLAPSAEQAGMLDNALQLLEWSEHDLKLIATQRDKLTAEKAPVQSVDALTARYAKVIDQLLTPQAMASYEDAQQAAERLPIDLLLDALKAHGELNKQYLNDSRVLIAWVDDLRARADRFYDQRRQLAGGPAAVQTARTLQAEAAFLEAAVRGIQVFAQHLVAFERFLKSRPGILDTPLIGAMNRLHARVNAIKAAYDANDAATLKSRVDAMEADTNVKPFYDALPGAMQITRLIGKVGVATLAAAATGGVGGLLTGGVRSAATGITLRGALTFAGTAVLETATFTAVNAAGSALLFDEKISFGTLLKDFAWNLGLFAVLRGLSGVSTSMLRAAELQALAGPMQLSAGFPLAHGWGLLRFRIEQNRWPNDAELAQMNVESVLMLAGIAVSSGYAKRWVAAHQKATALSTLYREYGWRFEALEAVRIKLGGRILNSEAGGKGNDQAELDGVRGQAQTLEQNLRDLLQAVVKDKRFDLAKVRGELNALRTVAPDLAAELLTETLGLPAEAGLRRAARASFTYGNGKTSALEQALAPNYRVTKTTDPKSGLKTVTATSTKAPTLIFQERAPALDFDTGLFDVRKLMLDLGVTTPAAQRMLWRLLADEGMASDASKATRSVREKVKQITKRAGKSADDALSEMHAVGRVRSGADPAHVTAADTLRASGILNAAEWLEARSIDNQRGVVAEWLTKTAVPPAAGARVLRRVTVQADLFEDAAGAKPAIDAGGRARLKVTAAETDLLYVRENAGVFEVETVVNVKASGEKGMARSATVQNANLGAVLDAAPGDLVKLQLHEGVRFARVTAVSALDGATTVDLTGKLRPGAGIHYATSGPKGASGFTSTLAQDRGGVRAIAELLSEQQMIQSGEY